MKRPTRPLALAVLVASLATVGCSAPTQSSSRASASSHQHARASLGAGDSLGGAIFSTRSRTESRLATARVGD
ncbi:MAG: hypothetical protein KIS87_01960 [Phycisphaeraceae bacterium]|nr:hypothetical protein [Phycisphaeraceae bacterium]